ncbi:MAG: hypothetical protein GOVbin5978_21 [Prokaryotic dsDNA virus sp.]|nr:MAG: hypothetical protein GOVbin5978_21 [Prokaryotic dsDNA virus sp.]|tara:strand:- start:28586 stop:29341 length:756 start_codon:yes stop_codon:yes gene_type:complete
MALITATQVIDTAFTNKNTDQYLVKPAFIEIAEHNFLMPAIGEKLYENISEDAADGVQWTYLDVECQILENNNIVFVHSNNIGDVNFISVGDFVTSPDLPLYEDGTNSDGECCRGFNKVIEVDKNNDNNVIAFKISGAPKVSTSLSKIKVRKPNGVLVEDYVRKYLAFCVKFEMLPDMSYNTTSQGVVENVAEFTMPVDAKKLSFLRNETFKKSEAYQRIMIKFLEDNDESYPDYTPDGGNVSKKNGIILY